MLIEFGSSVPQKGGDGHARRRLQRERNAGRSSIVGCEQLTVDDQALAELMPEIASKQGGRGLPGSGAGAV